MKQIAVVSLVAAACFSQAQLKYTMYQNGVKVGDASVSEKVTSHGKSESMHLSGTVQGMAFSMANASIYDLHGAARIETMTMVSGAMGRSVSVKFKGNRAIVAATTGKSKQTSSIAAPSGAHLADASEFWFSKSQPKVGSVVKATKFNMEKLVWEESESTYVGDETVTVSGRKLKGHKVTTKQGGQTGIVYLDSHGDVLLYEANGLKLERKF